MRFPVFLTVLIFLSVLPISQARAEPMHVSVGIEPGGPFDTDGGVTYELSLDNGSFNLRHFYEQVGQLQYLTRASIRHRATDYNPPYPYFWRIVFDVPVGSNLNVGSYTNAQGGNDFFTYDLNGPFNNFDIDMNGGDPCFRTIANFSIDTLERNAAGTAIENFGGTAAMHCCPEGGYCPYSPLQPALYIDFYYSECQALDLSRDRSVNLSDLSLFLSSYGRYTARADFNDDGAVDLQDLSRLLTHFGQNCGK